MPADSAGKDGKPDEGIQLDQLTSENHGAAEGPLAGMIGFPSMHVGIGMRTQT